VRLISRSRKKTDRIDAEALARLARLDPKLLSPIKHRKNESRQHLMVLRSRDAVVSMRTKLVNHVRHQVKVFGERIPSISTPAFGSKAPELSRVMIVYPGSKRFGLAENVEAIPISELLDLI